jgi:U3 small nucleolar RNA-associated protein 18
VFCKHTANRRVELRSLITVTMPKSKKHQSPLVQVVVEGNDDAGTGKRNDDFKKNKRKRSSKDIAEEAEERRLTQLLFGGQGVAVASDDDDDDQGEGYEKMAEPSSSGALPPVSNDGALFELDTKGESDEEMEGDDSEGDQEDNELVESQGDDDEEDDGPVWVDEDDVDLEVDLMKTNRLKKLRKFRDEQVSTMKATEMEQRLRDRFETSTMTNARTDWARVKEVEEDDAVEEETSAEPMLASSSRKLPPQVLQVMRCPDANQKEPNDSTIQAVHFHRGSDPDRPLMLTGGLDKTLRFFQVGAEGSTKIHGIHFPKLPIYSAQFLGDTGNVVVSGRRNFFYIYDAAAGKLDLVPRIMGREEKSLEKCTASPDGKTIAFIGNDGYIILVDVKSKQWVADLKMNGSARAVTFTPDSQFLIASGSDGDVYRFDLRSQRCVERFSNEDGTVTSTLSSSFKHLAVGAESGVVNIYNDRKAKKRAPIKSLLNLPTSADFSRFNHDGQILAFSTRREKNGLKLLHVPTATVFSNWPTSKTPLNYVWSMDFSPESKFLAIGNDKGRCLLYKLMHYNA